MQHLSEKM